MKRLLLLFLCFIFIFSAGCSDTQSTSSLASESRPDPIEKFFTVQKNEDNTYDFEVLNLNGSALISQKGYSMEPSAYLVSDTLLCLSAGGGESTKWTRFCDLEQNLVSDTFYNVIYENEKRVVYSEFKENKHYIIVRDIFNATAPFSETVLENTSMDADPTLAASQDSDPKTVAVTYYTGLSREPNTVTVNIGE